jgi:hypothetical protein
MLRRIAFLNTLLKERSREGEKGLGDEEEDLSSCWMTLRKYRMQDTERGSTKLPALGN